MAYISKKEYCVGKTTLHKFVDCLSSNAVFIGVGNELSGDDGFGPRLIERVKPALSERAIDGGLAPENWTGPIIKLAPDTLIIADAVAFGGKAGEIRLLKPEDLESGFPSTHGPGLSSFIEYMRQSLPKIEIIILAVFGRARPARVEDQDAV